MKRMSMISGAFAVVLGLSMGWFCCIPEPARAQQAPVGLGLSQEEITALVGQLTEARADLDKYRAAAPSEKKFALAALLAVALNIALGVIKRLLNVTSTAKKVIPWVALGLAVPIALLAKYGADGSWADAIIFAGAGPGAVVVQELLALFKPKSLLS